MIRCGIQAIAYPPEVPRGVAIVNGVLRLAVWLAERQGFRLKGEVMGQDSGRKDGEGIGMADFAGLVGMPPETLLTVKALGESLGVCSRTVWRMVDRCELPRPFKIGNRGRWKAGRVVAWINRLADRKEQESEEQLKRMADWA